MEDDMEKKLTEEEEEEEEGVGSEELRSATFQRLKSYTLQLLDLLRNPQNQNQKHCSVTVIPDLLRFLQNSSPATLQPFFDYTLFPLLLLLDAAIQCRSTQKVDSQEKYTMSDIPETPFKVSDSVAEGVVNCLEELLKKCNLNSVDQMVVLIKKLTLGALLSPSEASEEFREGILLCFRALLLSLNSCSDATCSCKQIPGLPALSDNIYNDRLKKTFKYGSESKECLLAFLRSQTASAAVGHWISLLLKAADTEAARGQRGSARIRIEAFKTLRVLVAKVGSADALAFFLPGIVSNLAKVLHGAKTMISGAAGSVESIDLAIRGLAEFLMIVLQDDVNASALDIEVSSNFDSNECKSTLSLLEELRHLQVKDRVKTKAVEDRNVESEKISYSQTQLQEMGSTGPGRENLSLHVTRTKDWIQKTSAHVNKLLSATYPHICIHSSQKVRKGLLDAIKGLLLECFYTLGESRLMFLECLCALVVDESDDVSSTAQDFLECLFSQSWKHRIELDAAEIFIRHLEKLPKVVLSNEESLAVLHAQQLLTIIFYSGPRLLVDHLQSPVGAARFLDVFAACLSHNSVFSGSLGKITSTSQSSTLGYLPSIAELKSGSNFFSYGFPLLNSGLCETPKCSLIEETQEPIKTAQKNYELPRMPPWFSYVGSLKLYQPLARILRLVGLSIVADYRSEGLLSHLTESLLGYFRKLVTELRLKDYNKESWQSWYDRTGSGQLLRQASTAACMLNEMIFGLSDQAINDFARIFHRSAISIGVMVQSDELDCTIHESFWKMPMDKGVKSYLVDCIGGILHEYLSAEVWNIPLDRRVADLQLDVAVDDISLYFFQDAAMLHEVIIDGVGISNLCLGTDFVSSGFLHSSLYLLLENLSSSNYRVRSAADSVLHILSTTSGYSMVGQLVLENADYVIDSICRQLRHLDLNHHVPNVIASILSYIGVAQKILPLLEEPMRRVSMELEILGRHQHPDLTPPFLKAVAEIVKASKREACLLLPQAESYAIDVRSIISNAKETTQDQWEAILFKFSDSRRYRRTVGSIAGSCITAAIPLLASFKQEICLASLDIIERSIRSFHQWWVKDQVVNGKQQEVLEWTRDGNIVILKLKETPIKLCVIFVKKVTNGGITRAKQHLMGKKGNVAACKKCPPDVREELWKYLEQKKIEDSIATSRARDPFESENEVDMTVTQNVRGNKGPMDLFCRNPEAAKRKKEKLRQTSINDACDKSLTANVHQSIARFWYQAGLSFNLIKLKSFEEMVTAIGSFGPNLRIPSYHEIRVPLLNKELEFTEELLKDHKEQWRKHGCSIMSDAWTDRKSRSIINFLVNSAARTMFLKSVDASDVVKSGDLLFEMLDSIVEEVGEENVVQVISDNGSNYVSAGKKLEEKRPHLFWTPCAAHCIDLMLEDIGKLPVIKKTIQRGISLVGFIYGHTSTLSLMRQFTNKRELVRHAVTRFATSYLSLERLHQEKTNLRKMFTSEEWTKNKLYKEVKGKQATKVVLMPSFWKHVVFTLKVMAPLVRVLRLADGERKPAMGYIYEAIDRAKETITNSFSDPDKYKDVFAIIDKRWQCQLGRDLHAAAHLLNPEFFYSNSKLENDLKVNNGLYNCITRLVPSEEMQTKIIMELPYYKSADGLFGSKFAVNGRKTLAPAQWWKMYGMGAPHLQQLAIKILSLTCSASGCERNWSVFEQSGLLALAKVEAAYKHERKIKEAIEEELQSLSLYQLKDTSDATEEGADENRLLPAMNKIWPFLVTCIQNRNPVAVRRCLNVISNVVKICGGDFFTRRFHTDGLHFWKLLTTSPFRKKSNFKDERTPLQLPYRSSTISSEDSLAETSYLKVQIAVLNMVADLCRNKRSATALEIVLKKVSGLVVGIACSNVVGLRDASLNALHGLASIDPDLVWLLLADIYYTVKKTETLSPPRPHLPEISEILPLPSSPKEYLYVQYGGQSYGFDIDLASVEFVFAKIDSQYQMYS